MKRSTKIGLVIALSLVGLVLIARLLGIGFGSKANGGAFFNFNVGKTESRSNTSSSSTSSSSDNSGFNSRRVFFVNGSAHRLSQRIGTLVAQRLKDSPQIERFDLEKSPAILLEGAESPDLFLRINLTELKEEGIFPSSLKATVTASIGSAPWQSSYYSQSSTTPPLVHFTWNATLEHETTFSGIRSDHYAAAAQNIADELTKGISNQLSALSAKYTPLPELPRDFYGPYQPVGDFDFLKEFKARRAYSYYGLLTHNETFWRFQTATNPVPQLQRIISQLEAAQWKLSTASLTNTEDYQVRFRQDDVELEIFRLRADRTDLPLSGKKESATEFVVHYRKPFSQTELEAALEKLFVEHTSIETLLPFQHSFSAKQREKFYALLEKTPTASPRATIQLAENYLHRKETNAAVNMLVRAKAMTTTLNDYSALESDIETMAKKISPKQKLKLEVTPETYRDLGFLEITNAPQMFELERDPGQPVLLFTIGERGPEAFCFTIRPPQKGSYPWTMIESREGVRSSMSSSFTVPVKGNWEQSFTFEKHSLKVAVLPLHDGKRIKVTVQTER